MSFNARNGYNLQAFYRSEDYTYVASCPQECEREDRIRCDKDMNRAERGHELFWTERRESQRKTALQYDLYFSLSSLRRWRGLSRDSPRKKESLTRQRLGDYFE